MKISFFYNDVKPILGVRMKQTWIKRILRDNLRTEGFINFIFCTDEYLLNLNQRFLAHDYYTDILTFDYSREENVQVEIYISRDRAKENAKGAKVTVEQELCRLMAHGVLHVVGFQDDTKERKEEMRSQEDICLRNLESIRSTWNIKK